MNRRVRAAGASDMVGFVRNHLRELADPAKATPMQAYMKTDMPFYGVQKPARAFVLRKLKHRFAIATAREYRDSVLALWRLPHREEKYLAIGVALSFPRLIGVSQLPLYKRLIIEGAWWDFVDDLAIRLVGAVWLQDRDRVSPMMDVWIDHRDLWLRRAAIIGQIKHKTQTDEARLFDYCARRAHEKEFFIRKAIGWALRSYAYTNPAGVRRFVKQQGERLSPLSIREAMKHLD